MLFRSIPSDGAMNAQSGFNAPGFAPGSGQATGSVSTSSLAPKTSGVSMGSNPSTDTATSWDGSTGPSQLPIIPIIGGLANAESPYPRDSIYDPNVYYSSGSNGPSSVDGSSQAASSSRRRDGKGRRLFVVGNKGPVAHLDGQVFEEQQPEPEPEPEPVPVTPAGPAPPAYSFE